MSEDEPSASGSTGGLRVAAGRVSDAVRALPALRISYYCPCVLPRHPPSLLAGARPMPARLPAPSPAGAAAGMNWDCSICADVLVNPVVLEWCAEHGTAWTRALPCSNAAAAASAAGTPTHLICMSITAGCLLVLHAAATISASLARRPGSCNVGSARAQCAGPACQENCPTFACASRRLWKLRRAKGLPPASKRQPWK